MIQYALKCSEGHLFDSWFQNAEAFDKLRQTGMVTCAVCGSCHVEKAIMAPRVRPARSAATPPAETAPSERSPTPLSEPASAAEQALVELKKQIESNSDYVGTNFAKEARAIHTGDAPDRAIYGEANAEEAKSLIEDGVPVAPLPFLPGRKSN
ncbi:DUF1178 family protein [Cognatishimia activa]|uniref:DUF1178 family protein n=1 Tax=Cognatishimia activa TaxID=1715691 RepID=UPI0022323EA6|nr:DUF1178 family protein [Cognatishimia activa]UZD91801.1 DUF1178 family protein [Cognatishimia activa]